LPPEIYRQFDLDNITYIPDTYVPKELNEYISDIVLKIPVMGSNGDVTVSILIEHKSSVDHFTCLQLLTYITNGYNLQHKQHEKLSVIVPVIYYHGKGNWKFRSLDMLFVNVPELFRRFIPAFDIQMFRVQEYTVSAIHNIAEARLRAALMVQKGQFDNLVAIMDYVRVINILESDKRGNFLYTLFVYMSHIPTFEPETIIEITNLLTTEMRTKSKTFIDHFREEGKQEGIQQGSLQSRYEFARKLLQRNMPLEDICELTDLTMEEVKGIKV
jgi:predicted transposase/invertase (TIGR01784 family)